MLAYTCAGCHGTDGSSVGPASPHIASSDPIYFVDTMLAYKKGERQSTIMTRMAKGYTEDQIEQMADWFAKQPLVLQKQDADPAKAARGKTLHEEYCERCHEDGGRDHESGILAGQWMPWLHYAMQDFMSGARYYPRKMESKVKDMVEAHGDGAIEDVIHYYGSQH
jgi:sulfide dehydrogenase cytochrome subunit